MAEQPTNGAAGRPAPRPPGSNAPDDGQWAYDREDASLLVDRLRDLQRAADEAASYAHDCRVEYAQAKRKAAEADLMLRTEIARRLRPQRTYPAPRAAAAPTEPAASCQGQFAGDERDIPPTPAPTQTPAPEKEKKPRKPRKAKAPPFEPMTGPLTDGQRSWFAALRRVATHLVVPNDVAVALCARGLCRLCQCVLCHDDNAVRYTYVDPSNLLTVAVASATGPTAPARAGEVAGWIVLDNREGAPAPQWPTVYPDVECARIAVEAALGIPDRAQIGSDHGLAPQTKGKGRKGGSTVVDQVPDGQG